jgi:predicted exporter
MKLFQNSPLSNKLFVVVDAKSYQDAQISAEIVSDFLSDKELGIKSSQQDDEFLLSFYHYYPNLWDSAAQNQVAQLLTPENIEVQIEENIDQLQSPFGMVSRNFIVADPLGLMPVFAQTLRDFNFSTPLDFEDGFIKTKNGGQILLVFDYLDNFLDLKAASKINEAFDELKKIIPAGAEVFYIGAPRFTDENHKTIISDVVRISIISVVLMLALFLVFLRDKKALFIYVIPPAVIIFASTITSWFFGGMSVMTLGFGSVLMGLTVDYCLYMFFAIKAGVPKDKFLIAQKMFKPIMASAITSIITFLFLLFSGIEVFRQTAVFCASGLAFALFISLFVSPFIFSQASSVKDFPVQKNRSSYLSFKKALLLLCLIFVFFVAAFNRVDMNVSLETLNSSSKDLQNDRKKFDEITGSAFGKNEMLFVYGNSYEEVLENNEKISALNPQHLKLYKLFPSQKTKDKNIADWRKFWGDGQEKKVERIAQKVLRKRGLKDEMFSGFYDFLITGNGEVDEGFNLNVFFNPIITIDGKYVFANIIPIDTQIQVVQNIDYEIISNDRLSKKISADILSRFTKIFIALFLCAFFALLVIFKSIKLSLLSILPAVSGICAFFIFAAVFGVEINLIGLYAMPLLIGLGTDYGVFMVYQNKSGRSLHPTKALVIAALSTIIGFGSLMSASHSVLFIIGFMVCSGITVSVLVSIFVLPSLIKVAQNQS